jgi:hypothetical protein
VFHKTTSLEYSGKNFFVKMILGRDFNISFVTVPIEALVHPLCLIPDCGVDSNINLLFYQYVIGANSLGKELSSLQIFKYCKCV